MPEWITLELTNKCNKACPFCGRAKARARGEMEQGEMELMLLNDIVKQFEGSVIQFNKDGEPLLHKNIWAVGQVCQGFTTNVVTNGILLWEKADALADNFTTITVSVYEDDAEQFEAVKKFVEKTVTRNPIVYVKFLGDYYNSEYEKLGIKTLRRSLHNPLRDTDYERSKPPIPEVGVCLDFLYKPAVDWQGKMYICNRYDPEGIGVIGDLTRHTLDEIWNGQRRQRWLRAHMTGQREQVPFCETCEYWGFPAA